MGKNKPALNTVYDFEAEDGQVLHLTLNYLSLYQLRAKHKEYYEEYNRIMTTNGVKDEFDNLKLLYTGYLCGLVQEKGSTDGAMDFEEFISILPPDRDIVMNAVGMLIAPKKTMASADRS